MEVMISIIPFSETGNGVLLLISARISIPHQMNTGRVIGYHPGISQITVMIFSSEQTGRKRRI
ncbi:MAG: hypothetical protein MZV63_03275 [Marinilabiliales bacterium]|nr:hypothetical protein [Marinilabiliales bacterium]